MLWCGGAVCFSVTVFVIRTLTALCFCFYANTQLPSKKAKNKELHLRNKDKKHRQKKQPGAKLHNVVL
jgi:hypothetical protein